MFSRFGLLADWIIDHRWTTLFLLVVWTIVMAIGHYDPYLLLPEPGVAQQQAEPQSVEDSEFDQAPVRPSPGVSPIQVASGDVIVVARSEGFFTPDGATAMRAAIEALESLDQVDSVLWMDRAPMMNIFGLQEPILPRGDASQARFEAAREQALKHPLVAGQLLSRDAKTMLLMVGIDWLFVTQDSDCTDLLRDTAAAAAARYPGVSISFQVTGEVPIRVSRAASNRDNELKYQAIGYSIALIIAFVLFRGLSSVLIVALAPAFGVFWTLGLLHFLGYDDNPFNSVIVPVLLCMVGFTDGVHMMVQIRRHRALGLSAPEAARQSIREVGLACWLTSLTTAIGFGSLALAHHEVVREFGYCCVIGVLTTFVAVITIIPLACASPLGKRVHTGYGRNLVDKNLSRISVVIDFVLAHSKAVCIFAILLTLILSALTLQLRPDERLTSSLASRSEPAMALAHIDKAMGGMETAEVSVRWHPRVADGDPEIGEVVSAVDDVLLQEPLIGNPLSIRNLIDALPGEGATATRMSLLELLPPPLKRAYYRPEASVCKGGIPTSGHWDRQLWSGVHAGGAAVGIDPTSTSQFSAQPVGKRGLALEESVSDRRRPRVQSRNGERDHLRGAGDRLSIDTIGIDLDHSQHFSARGDRVSAVGDGTESGNRQCLRLHRVPRDRGGRHDSLPDPLSRTGSDHRQSQRGDPSGVHWSGHRPDHDHGGARHRLQHGPVE